MILYGICVTDIEDIDWEKVLSMVKKYDQEMYEDITKYGDKDVDYIRTWFEDYPSSIGSYGFAGFLRDFIEETTQVSLDVEMPWKSYLGISLDTPWNYHSSVLKLSEEEFTDIIHRCISQFTCDNIEIRFWNEADDSKWYEII